MGRSNDLFVNLQKQISALVAVGQKMASELQNVHINIEGLLPSVSGLFTFCTFLHFTSSESTLNYRHLIVGKDGYDVLRLVVWSSVFLGLVTVTICGRVFACRVRYTLGQWMAILVGLLLLTFAISLVISQYETQTLETLETSLQNDIKTSFKKEHTSREFLQHSELWDTVQISLRCCGSSGPSDYINNAKVQNVPLSCCVLKRPVASLIPHDSAQCQHDALLGVRISHFVHTHGCSAQLSMWLEHLMNTLSANLYLSVSLQVINLLFLSWKGLYSSVDL